MGESSGPERVLAGRYRLLSEIGRGGMGVVWRARDEVLDREVAVKEVCAPIGLDEYEIRQLYARLAFEGRAAARVDHPSAITIHDVAVAQGVPWIVMELVRGPSLADVLDAEGPLAPARAAQIGARVLAALRVAHAAGVLHRDVKPANVLISDNGRVVLTDFGIAMIQGTSGLTQAGELIGSMEFLAPERAIGRVPGPESDLWSLGVMLYMAVEGVSPFFRDTPLSTMRAVVDEEFPPLRKAGPLGPVLYGLLRKDPAQRLSGLAAQRMLNEAAAGLPPLPEDHPPNEAPPPAPGYESFVPRASPYAPTVSSRSDLSNTAPRRRWRTRTRLSLVAGVLALILAACGAAWALTNSEGDGERSSTSPMPDDVFQRRTAPWKPVAFSYSAWYHARRGTSPPGPVYHELPVRSRRPFPDGDRDRRPERPALCPSSVVRLRRRAKAPAIKPTTPMPRAVKSLLDAVAARIAVAVDLGERPSGAVPGCAGARGVGCRGLPAARLGFFDPGTTLPPE